MSTRDRRAADDAQRRLEDFCLALGIAPDENAACLYLAELCRRGLPGRVVRDELRHLDRGRMLAGQLPYCRYDQVWQLVRGMHATAEARPAQRHRRPLYTEDVVALIAAVGPPPTADRDTAALLLAAACHLPATVLRSLQWHHVRLLSDGARLVLPAQLRAHSPRGVITVPNGPAGLCPVEALRQLRRRRPGVRGDDFVFGLEGRPPAIASISTVLAVLPARGDKWRSQVERCPHATLRQLVDGVRQDGVREHRDRLLLALAFAACLTTSETTDLRLRDVERLPAGLLLRPAGRRRPVAVPPASAAERCPVRLWDRWRTELRQRGWTEDLPVFPLMLYGVLQPRASGRRSLNDMVRDRCEGAGLDGSAYDFSSLRTGFLRSAARAGAPEHAIAAQAGLRYVDSVQHHVRRERLIMDSAAARVGL